MRGKRSDHAPHLSLSPSLSSRLFIFHTTKPIATFFGQVQLYGAVWATGEPRCRILEIEWEKSWVVVEEGGMTKERTVHACPVATAKSCSRLEMRTTTTATATATLRKEGSGGWVQQIAGGRKQVFRKPCCREGIRMQEGAVIREHRARRPRGQLRELQQRVRAMIGSRVLAVQQCVLQMLALWMALQGIF